MDRIFIILGIAVAIAGAVVLAVVVRRTSGRVQLVRPPSRARSREEAMKERILIERLTRRVVGAGERMGRRARTMTGGVRPALERGYRRLRFLAQEHAKPETVAIVSCAERIVAAQEAVVQEDYDGAEEQLLACLKVEPKHRDAYLGLADLYRRRKELSLAEETLRFLRKLIPRDPEVMAAHALILRDREKYGAALREIESALAVEARNPRYLDAAVEFAILERDGRRARKYLAALREANPDNAKLGDLEEKVERL